MSIIKRKKSVIADKGGKKTVRALQGNIIGHGGGARDIVEQQRMEQALRSVFKVTPVGICIMKNRVFQSANNLWYEIIGYTEAELRGQTTRRLYESEEEYQRVGREVYADLPKRGLISSETRLRRKDGTFRDVILSVAPLNPSEPFAGEVVAIHDVTERKRAEAVLQASERQFSLIYASISDVIFYLAVEPDGRFRFVSVNSAFLKVTGLTEGQVTGKLFEDVIPAPAQALVLGKYKEAIRTKKAIGWEEVSEYPAGKRYGEVLVTPIIDDDGNCTRLMGTVHDITERKKAEEERKNLLEQLVRSEKLAAVGELISGV